MTDDSHLLTAADDVAALETGDDTPKLQTGDDLALAALSDTSAKKSSRNTGKTEEEVSDDLALALTSLQNVIERNATELERVSNEMKEKRESLKNFFDNDNELSVAEQQVEEISSQLKERKAKLQTDPQVTSLKVQIGELNEQKKEVEEALSNHLVNYYQMTNSTSFDTSDGDQWEFNIRAKVKPRKKSS
ncbi:MAG: hypothetical protein M3Q81_03235 [bacterium]|nr:hypothetical protein [bacterium]